MNGSMKIIVGAGLFLFMFTLLFQLGLLSVILKPEWYAPAMPDSFATGQTDSLNLASGDSTSGAVPQDSTGNATLAGPMPAETPGQSTPVEMKDAGDHVSVQADTGAMKISTSGLDSATTAGLKAKAKFFENMDPETAAKILGHLKDDEVRVILMSVKKRVAGKILGAMEPDHASRIVR